MDKKIVYLFGTPEKTQENYDKNAGKKSETPQEFETIPANQVIPMPTADQEMAVLYRLGQQKEDGTVAATWDEIASVMNELFRQNSKPETESSWRKKYAKMRDAVAQEEMSAPPETVSLNELTEFFRKMENREQRIRDQRMAYERQIRSESRQDQIIELFKQTIEAWPPCELKRDTKDDDPEKAVYAMLSDIHYGLTFSSFYGEYNSEIAKQRVLRFADEVILAGRREKASVCFVSLMGDMISGVIHQTIRVENKENLIQQVVGVSELVSQFLYYLGRHFKYVYVNSVDGNHSRIDPNLENVLRGERLDSLVPWYCKARLANQENISFVNNEIDATIGSFRIGNRLYVCVHGDMEKDLKVTATVIEKAIGQHVDYLLAGHMHVPEMRTEDTMYIRNGSVCGSGDDYTVKKRLFSPPCQVFMIIGKDGVRSVHTVNLIEYEEEKSATAE